MTKLTLIIMLLFAIGVSAKASNDSIVVNNNTYEKVSVKTTKTSDKLTPFFYKVKDVEYPIYLTKNGACYIIRTSRKTGKEYKQYLPKGIAASIKQRMK